MLPLGRHTGKKARRLSLSAIWIWFGGVRQAGRPQESEQVGEAGRVSEVGMEERGFYRGCGRLCSWRANCGGSVAMENCQSHGGLRPGLRRQAYQ